MFPSKQQQQLPQQNHNNEQTPSETPAVCTIACDKGHITAHKLILCDHSKYLQDILSKYPDAEHPIIILTELNITDVKILVYYMYTGELVVGVTNDSTPTSLLHAAQILKIDSLIANDDEQDDDEQDDADGVAIGGGGRGEGGSVSGARVDDMDEDDDENDDGITASVNITTSRENEARRATVAAATAAAAVAATAVAKASAAAAANVTTASDDIDIDIDDDMDDDPEDEDDDDDDRLGRSTLGGHLNLQDTVTKHSNIINNSINHSLDNKNNKIRCHLCNISLSDVKCLYRHVLTRHLPEKWGYKCEFCDREFSRDDHLMRHYTTKHKNMEFNREKIRETRRLNREMAKNFHDQISTV